MDLRNLRSAFVFFSILILCPALAAEVENYRITVLPEQIVYENSARDLVAVVNPDLTELALGIEQEETWVSLSPAERSEVPEYIVGYLVVPLRFDVEVRGRDGRWLRKRIVIPAHTNSAPVEVHFEDTSPYDFMKQGSLRLVGVKPTIIDLN